MSSKSKAIYSLLSGPPLHVNGGLFSRWYKTDTKLKTMVERVGRLPGGAQRLKAGGAAVAAILDEVGNLEALLWEVRGYLLLEAMKE